MRLVLEHELLDIRLEVEFDMSDKCREACRNIHEFWIGQDERMLRAECHLDSFEVRPDDLIAHCAAQCLLKHALGSECQNTAQLQWYFSKGQEGWPKDLGEYGIGYTWRYNPPFDLDDFETSTFEPGER